MQFTPSLRYMRSQVARIIPSAVITASLLFLGLHQAVIATAAPGTCEAIQDNPGLKSDCETLLSVRDTLAGGAHLNWSADTPMYSWDGVSLGGTERVTTIDLWNFGLSGTIPPELGNLSSLEYLDLGWNELSGEIPPELGNLSNLLILALDRNELSGEIPAELGNLPSVYLIENDFTGCIPESLRDSLINPPRIGLSLPFCDDAVPFIAEQAVTLGPGSPNQTVELSWDDGETVAIELRVHAAMPSYVPDSIKVGPDVTYEVDSWESNPRTVTFTRPGHGQIQITWSYGQ